MRLVFLLAILALALSTVSADNPRDYPPGINFMMRDVLIEKFRYVIVPSIMQEFKAIKPDDIKVSHWYAAFSLYDMVANIVPLTPEQLNIETREDSNTIYVKVTDFQMSFSASAYARLLFFGMHGHAEISLKVALFEFEVGPDIYEDGAYNALTIKDLKINVNVNADDINISHVSIGFLPSWLMDPIANAVVHHCQGAIDSFKNSLVGKVTDILNQHSKDIPDQMEIPTTSLSASLSFPNVPKLYKDRVEFPFDGTIFVTEEGYDPRKDHANKMPSYDPDDKNNIQFFINQHVLKTDIATAKKANLRYEITKDIVASLDLPDDVFTVKYFSLLFPTLACKYDSNVPIKISLGVDQKLDTEITFHEGGMEGKFSPNLQVYAGDDLAFTLSMTAGFVANIDFKVQDKTSFAHGSLKDISLNSMTVEKGTVDDIDLPEIVKNFEGVVYPFLKDTTDAILEGGVTIPVIPLFNGIFDIDLEMIYMDFKDEYLQVSFTLDIHQKIRMWKALQNFKGYKTTTKIERLLRPYSNTCGHVNLVD